jgi:UDP-N-acetylglucosamine diphosphorylase / glucose-1-phosphate thymidylyltransferase / UDP-N-acetylgalactosamine diphosphorylase / glucosamine-1-phosphate N-acetyltransferase / galactosamine-1-phosphate N-acetyltransferase
VKAVILAAGKGTRMKEITRDLPKPMLEIAGKPILEHIIDGITAAGVTEVFIVTGHRAKVIEDYFRAGVNFNAHIAFGRQISPDGTGKAAEPAREFIGDSPFILTYGDILVNPPPYFDMVQRFREAEFSGVVSVIRGEDVRHGGLNFFDQEFCFRRVVEKPTEAQLQQLLEEGWLKPGEPVWYNAGIYIFRPYLFEFTAKLQKSARGEYELTDAINNLAASGHKLAGFELKGRWVDVRDPETLARLRQNQ